MARARESWLRSDDPEKAGAAMFKCQSPAAVCGADGFCHYNDGRTSCFGPTRSGAEWRGKPIEEMTLKELRRAFVAMHGALSAALSEAQSDCLRYQDAMIAHRVPIPESRRTARKAGANG